MLVLISIVRALVIAVYYVALWAVTHPLADIPLGVLALVLFVYCKPYRVCRWCRRGGLLGGSVLARLVRYKPKRKRRRGCWRCNGKRLTRRLGSWHTHKVKDSLAQAWAEREWLR